MRDADVRSAVLADLGAKYAGDCDTRIVEEMGIWSGSVRIDVAVINGRLHGYELKSARDNLDRLDRQVELYRQVFDRVTLVTADKHVYKAYSKIPEWWGISIAALSSNGKISVRESRAARRNPELVPIQVARLLWRDEALAILERCGLDKGYRSANADELALRLVEFIPVTTLRREVRTALKSRAGWLGQSVGHKREVAVGA